MKIALNRIQSRFFFSLFILAGFFVLFILRFYFVPLILAVSLAVVFRPVYAWLRKKTRLQKDIAVLIVLAITVALVVVPLSFFGKQVVGEITDIYLLITETSRGVELVERAIGFFEKFIPQIDTQSIAPDIYQMLRGGAGWVLQNAGTFFSATAQFVGNLFLALFAYYYFLRDGDKFRAWYLRLSPLSKEDNEAILKKLAVTVNSTIRGNVIVAVVQGILVGAGLMLFGVPNPIFWGMISMLMAFIPMVGTSIILIPSMLYLWFIGATTPAIGLLLWGSLLVGFSDNLLRPYLIEREIKIHPLLILLSALGGIASFGIIGFIVGPLILSLFMALLDIYPKIAFNN